MCCPERTRLKRKTVQSHNPYYRQTSPRGRIFNSERVDRVHRSWPVHGQLMASGLSRREIGDQSNGIEIPADENPFRVTTSLCLVCARLVLSLFCFCITIVLNSEERSSFLDRLNALGRIMADLIHHRTHGRPSQPFIRARTYQFQQAFDIGLVARQPICPGIRAQNYRHSVMNLGHECVGGGSDHRTGFEQISIRGLPPIPNPRHRERLSVRSKQIPRLFGFVIEPFPFIKSIGRNQTATPPE